MYNISRTQILTNSTTSAEHKYLLARVYIKNIHICVKNVYVNISKYVYICTTSAEHKYLLAYICE